MRYNAAGDGTARAGVPSPEIDRGTRSPKGPADQTCNRARAAGGRGGIVRGHAGIVSYTMSTDAPGAFRFPSKTANPTRSRKLQIVKHTVRRSLVWGLGGLLRDGSSRGVLVRYDSPLRGGYRVFCFPLRGVLQWGRFRIHIPWRDFGSLCHVGFQRGQESCRSSNTQSGAVSERGLGLVCARTAQDPVAEVAKATIARITFVCAKVGQCGREDLKPPCRGEPRTRGRGRKS